MTTSPASDALRIGLLWRGDRKDPAPRPAETRLAHIFEAFEARDVRAEPVVYAEEATDAIRAQLLALDAVIAWVDPIVRGRERGALDALLRDVAAAGVFVSAHPDVILAMGTKEVLYRTRTLPWGSDTHIYRDADELSTRLLPLLRDGPRVLKQDRGSGGNGVWKLELSRDGEPATADVRVQPAARDARVEEMPFREFLDQRRPYFEAFDGAGCFVDQPVAERLAEGMTRCYMAHDRVAGFGHQFVTALMPPTENGTVPNPPPRLYYGPNQPEFQALRRLLESGWLAQMQSELGLTRESLPVIWDADFLLGPKTPAGEDTYQLCEINVSGVLPIPDESVGPLADAAVQRAMAARLQRRAATSG